MSTLDYYNSNAQQFVDGSLTADMSEHYKHFLAFLSEGANILDLGCGSGRDTAFFRKMGHTVTPVDGSVEICKLAEKILQSPVRCLKFEDIDYQEEFDGIWACASLLHVDRANMLAVLEKVHSALKPYGVLYASYKYGNEETNVNGRMFTNYNEHTILDLFPTPGWTLEEVWTTADVRPGRESERWVNTIVRKN